MQKREKGQKSREKERSCCSRYSYCTKLFKKHAKKGRWYKEKLPKPAKHREETEGEDAIDEGGGGSEIEEYEDSSVDIDDILDPEGAPARRILRLEATQRPPVVAGSGRVVKVGNLEE